MSTIQEIHDLIDDVVYANNNREITEPLLNDLLKSLADFSNEHNLAAVLFAGNETEDGQIIKSKNGLSKLDLRANNSDSNIELVANVTGVQIADFGGGFTYASLSSDVTGIASQGFNVSGLKGAAYLYLQAWDKEDPLNELVGDILIYSNRLSDGIMTNAQFNQLPSSASVRQAVMKQGVVNVFAAGADILTAKTSNAFYTGRIAFNRNIGNSHYPFETLLEAITPTADRLIKLQDKDGTIALLSDLSLPVGKTIFVNSLGNDATAQRERQDLPFKTIDAAVLASQNGDTMYIYGDQTVTTNIIPANKDIKFHFFGNSTITYMGTGNMIDDLNVQRNIVIKGDAKFYSPFNGRTVFKIENPNTTYQVECEEMVGAGSRVIHILGGTKESVLRVNTKSECTLVNWTLSITANAKGKLYCPNIINSATNGSRSVLDCSLSNPDFKIIGNLTANTFNGMDSAPVITMTGVTGQKGLIIEGNIIASDDGAVGFWGDGVIFMNGGEVEIIGNIEAKERSAYQYYWGNGNIKHVGNVFSTGIRGLLKTQAAGQSFGLEMIGNQTLTGALESLNTNQGGGYLRHKGVLKNEFIGGNVKGFVLGTNAGYDVVFDGSLIQIDDLTAPEGISATANKDIKIFNDVKSNASIVNITNVIASTNYNQDVNYN